MTHKECQIKHFIRKAEKRHGIKLTPKSCKDLARQIKTHKARFVKALPSMKTLHVAYYKNNPLPTIYDSTTEMIATTPDWGYFRRLAR